MPQKWYYKTMIPIPGFLKYKISFLKKWENLHHYLTYFERTLFIVLLFGEMFQNFPISYIGLVHSVLDNALSKRDLVALMSFFPRSAFQPRDHKQHIDRRTLYRLFWI